MADQRRESPSAQGPATDRWVAPPGRELQYTVDGLLDTTRMGSAWYSGDRPQPAARLAGTQASYVLLAPGGAGKTTLVARLRQAEPDSRAVDLGMLTPESLPQAIRAAAAESSSVFIDALDEALQRHPQFGYMLTRLLRERAASNVSWRIACRPASWSLDLAQGMKEALPGFQELDLLPLDAAAIEVMAGSDAGAFRHAVAQAGLTRLLAQPLDAEDLLAQWRTSGRLPATRSAAMHYSVGRLLQESGAFREPPRQDDQRRMLVAEHLGAIAMFCGVGRYSVGGSPERSAPDTEQTAMAVTSVPLGEDPDVAGAPVTVDDLREVLGTSLFSAAGDGTVAFRHQAYEEFLAASLLSRRRVGGARLSALLGADVNGVAAGPMLEVLGWLLAMNASVPPELITANARQLLSAAGLELASDTTREQVVAGLLRGAADGTFDEGWGVDTSSLSHPGLADQLHAAATAATNKWEIFWISRIARHCVVFDAADDLLAIAHDTAWPAHMRAEAVQSFAAVAPADRLEELEDLLDLSESEDPDDELLAATLRATAGALDAERLAKALRPRRARNLIGGYSTLLTELPTLIRPVDALPILRSVLSRAGDWNDRFFQRLVAGLTSGTWQKADPAQLTELGELIGHTREMRRLRRLEPPLPWEVEDRPADRLAIAVAALKQDERSVFTVMDLRLLTQRDIGWLLDWTEAAPPGQLDGVLGVLGRLAWTPGDAETADRILSVPSSHPAYSVLSDLQGHRLLTDRPDWVQDELDQASERPRQEDLLAQLRDTIVAAQRDPNLWWKVVLALAADADQAGSATNFGWDLTQRPLWLQLTAEEVDELWRLALVYLGARTPDPNSWRSAEGYSMSGFADWAGAFALGTAALHRPDLLASVPVQVWEVWAPTILATPLFDSASAALDALHRSAPPAATGPISAALADLARTDTVTFQDHPLASSPDDVAILALRDVALNQEGPPGQRDAAMSLLRGHSPALALDVAHTILAAEPTPPAEATTTLAALSPDEFIAPLLANKMLGDTALPDLDVENLSAASLVGLASILLNRPAPSEETDKDEEWGFHPVTEQSRLQRVESHVLQTMAARGMVADLASLAAGPAHGTPSAPYITHLLQRARQREALTAWQPVEPSTLVKLLAAGDARLVRDSAGLVDVLLEQLAAIQRDLQQRILYRSLWDGEPGDEGAKPKVEDDISDWLAQQLELRLSPHIVVDREIQVSRPRHAGIGTRIDITVTSPAGLRLGRVVFEAKRVQHPEVLTALDTQLVGQYMNPADVSHGIYIVYWVHPTQRPPSWNRKHGDPEALAATLRTQAQAHRPARHVEVVVLDIGPSS